MNNTMSYSSATLLLSCPQKYKYRKEDGLIMVGDDGSSPASRFGDLWHVIQELAAQDEPDPVFAAEDKLKWRDPPGDYRTLSKAREGYDLWQRYWANTGWNVAHPEMTFETADDEHRTGRIDAIG